MEGKEGRNRKAKGRKEGRQREGRGKGRKELKGGMYQRRALFHNGGDVEGVVDIRWDDDCVHHVYQPIECRDVIAEWLCEGRKEGRKEDR